MIAPDEQMQSFVIRIWVEDTDPTRPTGSWRGHVVDVASGERRYFHALDEACAFIADQLRRRGIDALP